MFKKILEGTYNLFTGGKYLEYKNSKLFKQHLALRQNIDVTLSEANKLVSTPKRLEEEIHALIADKRQAFVSSELKNFNLVSILKNFGLTSYQANKIKEYPYQTLSDIELKYDQFETDETLHPNIKTEILDIYEKIKKDLESGFVLKLKEDERESLYHKIILLENSKDSISKLKKHLIDLNQNGEKVSTLNYSSWKKNQNFYVELYEDIEDTLQEIKIEIDLDMFRGYKLNREEYIEASTLLERQYYHTSSIFDTSEYDQYQVILNSDFKCQLRLYQEFFVKFYLKHQRVLLGDEMGLGKTIQALACIYQLSIKDPNFKALIIVPASLIINWEREISSKTKFHHLSIRGYKPDLFTTWIDKGGILISSYTSLGKHYSHYLRELENHTLNILITDESEYAKNPKTNRTKAVKALAKKSDSTIYMTGTPIQNNISEFIELIDHLNPSIASANRSELQEYGTIPKFKFKNMVKKLYLRRNQEDVLHELPDKIETIEWIELSNKELREHLDQLENEHFMTYRHSLTTGTKGKTDRLQELLEEYNNSGENVLVFSYFRHVIDHLSNKLNINKQIHGEISFDNRQAIIDSLEETPIKGQTILCQIISAGRGLNLQNASVIVIMEPQLNPALEDQAVARAFRMGQRRSVKVHKFIANDSIEERLLERLKLKREIFKQYAQESQAKDENPESVESEMKQISSDHAKYLKEKLNSIAS